MRLIVTTWVVGDSQDSAKASQNYKLNISPLPHIPCSSGTSTSLRHCDPYPTSADFWFFVCPGPSRLARRWIKNCLAQLYAVHVPLQAGHLGPFSCLCHQCISVDISSGLLRRHTRARAIGLITIAELLLLLLGRLLVLLNLPSREKLLLLVLLQCGGLLRAELRLGKLMLLLLEGGEERDVGRARRREGRGVVGGAKRGCTRCSC